jgi:cell division protein FtsW
MINGGWFGLGIGNSIQKKGYLSAAQTDFMFSIVIEELGLVMAIIILGILLFLILRIFRIGIKSKNTFNSMMCIGIAGMILIQAFINIGGITGIIPLTGVTFPFLSSGGSSLITLSVGIGFALNISADEKKKQYDAHNKRIHLEYTNQTLLDYPM